MPWYPAMSTQKSHEDYHWAVKRKKIRFKKENKRQGNSQFKR